MNFSRDLFDVGIITGQGERMLSFWRDTMGLEVLLSHSPSPGVQQYKLDLCGAVLKLNCLEQVPPAAQLNPALRLLLVADSTVSQPQQLCDPDGNSLVRVPPGYQGINTAGVHYAVSNEDSFHAFYADVLQLPRLGGNRYACAGATISFAWSPERTAGAQTGIQGYHYLTFQVMDAVVEHQALCARGATEVKAASAEHTRTDSVISFIADPDGNLFEISQRQDLVNAR